MRPTLLLLASLLLAGCFGGSEATPPVDDRADESTNDSSDMTLAPVALAISLIERPGVGIPPSTMALDPNMLEAKVGDRVVLTITNNGQAPHNLVIEGLDVDTDTISTGESLDVEFVAQEKGEFVMYCAVGGDSPTGHRAQGMEGTFVVS